MDLKLGDSRLIIDACLEHDLDVRPSHPANDHARACLADAETGAQLSLGQRSGKPADSQHVFHREF